MGQVEIGKTFGRLKVEAKAPSSNRGRQRWVCKCDCGETLFVYGGNLTSGNTKSCGCLMRERVYLANRTHGMSRPRNGISAPEYTAWQGMKARCFRESHADYKNYGARGITVCGRWLVYENFYADMGSRPSRQHSLDRVNNDGNYEPSNCRWATIDQQVKNRRRQRPWRLLTFLPQLKIAIRNGNLAEADRLITAICPDKKSRYTLRNPNPIVETRTVQ